MPTDETPGEPTEDVRDPTEVASDSTDEAPDGPTDREVVETASEAAEGVVRKHFTQSNLRDLDITVTFEDGMLEVDVYINPTDDAEADAEAVADEAARTARDAVDELFADA